MQGKIKKVILILSLAFSLFFQASFFTTPSVSADACSSFNRSSRCVSNNIPGVSLTECRTSTGSVWCCEENQLWQANPNTGVYECAVDNTYIPDTCSGDMSAPRCVNGGSQVNNSLNCAAPGSGVTIWCCPQGQRVQTTTYGRSCAEGDTMDNESVCESPRRAPRCTNRSVSGSTNCSAQAGESSWCCNFDQIVQTVNGSAQCVSVTMENPDTGSGSMVEPGEAPTNETFKNLNPLIIGSEENPTIMRRFILSTFLGDDYMSPSPSGIINRVIVFAFPIAGTILFIMILWGGFEILSGATSKKSLDQGKQRITAAVIGFLMFFVAYWIIKVVEAVFGVTIF